MDLAGAKLVLRVDVAALGRDHCWPRPLHVALPIDTAGREGLFFFRRGDLGGFCGINGEECSEDKNEEVACHDDGWKGNGSLTPVTASLMLQALNDIKITPPHRQESGSIRQDIVSKARGLLRQGDGSAAHVR